jgi:hypothetical protein
MVHLCLISTAACAENYCGMLCLLEVSCCVECHTLENVSSWILLCTAMLVMVYGVLGFVKILTWICENSMTDWKLLAQNMNWIVVCIEGCM